jgi:hypothetical protein
MPVNRKYDITAIVVIVLAIVGYAAFQPKFRLRSDMPTEFLDESSTMPAKKRAAEEKIAQAYWRCAVNQIQWTFGYGHRLPESPPVEFTVDIPEFGAAASDAATRDRYWRRLQRVWYLPSAWEKSYGWDLNAMTSSLKSAGQWLESQTRKITGLP